MNYNQRYLIVNIIVYAKNYEMLILTIYSFVFLILNLKA